MANGTITLTRNGSGELYGQILWSSVSNGTQANTSTVTASIQLKRPAGWYTQGTWKGSFNVGGTTKQISCHTTVRDSWVTIDTMTATVNHNADGSGSCYISGILHGPTQTSMEGTSVSGSETVVLDPIARFASLVSAPDFHDEEDPVLSCANPAGNGVTTLQACISLDGTNADIAYRDVPKTGSSFTFSLTEAERNMLRAATQGANSRQVKFCLRTVIGSSTGTASLTKTFTIHNPAPILSPTVTDSNSVTKALTGNSGKLIRYFSNAAVTIGAASVKQATIADKKVTCGSKSLAGDGTISGVENGTFVFSATDSRGNTTTKTVTTPFVNYVKLTCSLGNGIPDAGGNMTVTATGNYFNGSFGAKANSLQVCYRYKPYGGTFGSWTTMSVSISGTQYAATAAITGLDYQTAYVFECYAQDALTTVYSASRAVKAAPVFDWSETDFCFRVPVAMESGVTISAAKLTAQDSLDTIKTNGWYYWEWGDPPMGIPDSTGANYMRAMRVWTGNGGECFQEMVDMSDSAYTGGMIRRTIYGSVVYPWEWVNPPLILGIEYRTTERYHRKPVYAKAVEVGVLPNNSYKEVHIAYGITGIIRLDGYAYWSGSDTYLDKIPLAKFGVNTVLYSNSLLRFSASSDLSNYSAYAVVYYIKE